MQLRVPLQYRKKKPRESQNKSRDQGCHKCGYKWYVAYLAGSSVGRKDDMKTLTQKFDGALSHHVSYLYIENGKYGMDSLYNKMGKSSQFTCDWAVSLALPPTRSSSLPTAQSGWKIGHHQQLSNGKEVHPNEPPGSGCSVYCSSPKAVPPPKWKKSMFDPKA